MYLKVFINSIISLLIGLLVLSCNDSNKQSNKVVNNDSLLNNKSDSIIRLDRANSTLSAFELVKCYNVNEILADQNFKGKRFYVNGKIESIGKDLLERPYISFVSNDYIKSIQCFMVNENNVSRLRKGQKITILGTCDGLIIDVLMKNCIIVKDLEDL